MEALPNAKLHLSLQNRITIKLFLCHFFCDKLSYSVCAYQSFQACTIFVSKGINISNEKYQNENKIKSSNGITSKCVALPPSSK
jgi:hypothetical protein